MKKTMIMDEAEQQILNCANQLMNAYQLEPSEMEYILDSVTLKVAKLKEIEYQQEVKKLELKMAEPQSFKKQNHEESVKPPKPMKIEHKSGTLDDLLKDLATSGQIVDESSETDKLNTTDGTNEATDESQS